MPSPRTIRALLLAALLTLPAGCSSGEPPAYKLDGDACGAVPTATFETLAAASPAAVPSDLTQGLQGGNCAMDFDGTGGVFKLTTFIAIHPTGETAATAMYDDFKKSDTGAAGGDTTVTDLKELGSGAYVRAEHDARRPWKADDVLLYKIVVRDGSLVLSFVYSGFAKTPDSWPTTDQQFREKLQEAVKQIMKKLAP